MHRISELPPLPHIAAIYCRVSTESQATDDKTSPETQIRTCRQWCAENGWLVDEAHIYQDAHSGEEWFERPRLRALLDAAKHRAFGMVVALSVDRLTRNASHMVILLDELERAGVALDFVTEKLEDTPEGRLMLSVRAYAAEVENARRRERMLRNMRARVARGKPNPSNRATYGYQWADERDNEGRLLKLRMVERPETAAVVRRIWHSAYEGKTLRAIANELIADGITTPLGKMRWSSATVRSILQNPIYWGKPMALKTQNIPVPRELRHLYAKKTRQIARPAEEQVSLPATVAPALIPEEWVPVITERMRQNQAMALRNNQHAHTIESLLRGGYVRCGYCGGAMYSNRIPARRPGEFRAGYMCKNANRVRAQCSPHRIETHILDSAVWQRLITLLSDPVLIRVEVETIASRETPHADTLAGIDIRLTDIERKSANLRRVAEYMDNPEDAADLAGQISALASQRHGLETERSALQMHIATWEEMQAGLVQVIDWAERVTGNAEGLTYAEKRAVLSALRVDVCVYRAEHTPRATMQIHLPLSGAISLELELATAKRT